MANIITTQILEDGPKWHVVRLTGTLDTADVTSTAFVDVSALAGVNPANPYNPAPSAVAFDSVEYSIDDGLEVRIAWDATADVTFLALTGRGKIHSYVPIPNNAGAGKTGDVMYSTSGWTASAVLSFTMVFKFRKEV